MKEENERKKGSEDAERAVTVADLRAFKVGLILAINELLDKRLGERSESSIENSRRLRSQDVRRLLRISPSTLHTYRISGLLSARKVGGTYYYDRKDLKKFGV